MNMMNAPSQKNGNSVIDDKLDWVYDDKLTECTRVVYAGASQDNGSSHGAENEHVSEQPSQHASRSAAHESS